jgi:hypothetical protein
MPAISSPLGVTKTATQRYRALLRSYGTPSRDSMSLALLSSSLARSPENRADRTPGAPSRASTSMPESSASTALPVTDATARALRSALAR